MRKILLSIFAALLSAAMWAQSEQVVLSRDHLEVLSSKENGWKIVTRDADRRILAFGEDVLTEENITPTFRYLVEEYERNLSSPEAATRLKARRKAKYADIPTLMTCHWAQSDPFNRSTPVLKGATTHTLTGCVATAMAQVLYTHRMPRSMHGTKTYTFVPSEGQTDQQGNKRVTLTMDYSTLTLDWDNLIDSPMNRYTGKADCTEAQGKAVADMMYACGVAASMNYGYSGSGAMPGAAANGINTFFDGVRAEHRSFDEDVVLQDLAKGNPVMYSAGGHFFVIDGARQDGYLHCNLGWGGNQDGYYLPTDMAGYNTGQSIVRLWKDNTVTTYPALAELQGKYATAEMTPATSVSEDQWYILWNSGRTCSPCSEGLGQKIMNTALIPSGESTALVANQLVRFIHRTGSSYYIQDGMGNYFGGFTANGGEGVTTSARSNYFTVSQIQPGYFCLNSNGACYLDTNGAGSTVVGWGTEKPSDIYSNSSWILYPVTLSTSNTQPVKLNTDLYYTLCNSGNTASSEGYLVATTSAATTLTLQGVQRAVGSTDYSKYPDAFDSKNQGAYWKLEAAATAGQYYFRNVLTGTYLTSTSTSASDYVLGEKSPLRVVKRDDGTLAIIDTKVTSNADKGFLCATTHKDRVHPAGWWDIADAGSYWVISSADLPIPLTAVTLNTTSLNMVEGTQYQLAATLTPATTTERSLTWESSDANVATVSANGLVKALAKGSAVITVASAVHPEMKSTCTVTVAESAGVENLADFDPEACYVMSNPNSGAYLLALSEEDVHPSVRGVSGSVNGARSEYYNPADLTSDLSYWMVIKADDSALSPSDLTRDHHYYIYNAGARKYLYFTGSDYAFTTEPTQLYMEDKGTLVFSVNWGAGGSATGYQDYLALNVGAENPAQKGGASAGVNRYWKFNKITGHEVTPPITPDPKPDPKPLPDEAVCCIRTAVSALYFTTNEVIDNAPQTTYSLSAEPEDFILTPVEGVTNGFQITSINGKHVGHSVANSWDFSDDASTWVIEHVDGTPTSILKVGTRVGFGADVEQDGKGVFTDKSGKYWVIEVNLPTGTPSNIPLSVETSSPVYMLDGRALHSPMDNGSRGLYIVNGRKYLKR